MGGAGNAFDQLALGLHQPAFNEVLNRALTVAGRIRRYAGCVESLRGLWNAIEAFADSLASVSFGALFVATLFHAGNLLLRTRAWTTILQAAYPRQRVRWRDVFGAYCSGVGVNGVVPARGGDAIKLFLVHSRIEGATYPTLAASLLAETVFDMLMGSLLLIWAWQIGVADGLPGAGLFEFSWVTNHPQIVFTALVLLGGAVAALLIIHGKRVRAFWGRVEQGLAILRDRRRYARQVASVQAVGWVCRVLAAFFYLRAFHVDATLENALLVLVVGSVATSLPLTPGGLGPKQGLLVAVLGTAGTRSEVLALSVGMELSILLFNLALAAVCLSIMLRGMSIREAIHHARNSRAAAEAGTTDVTQPLE
jgi:uncharacterized membrane protein YbhN (UPF0104 family)